MEPTIIRLVAQARYRFYLGACIFISVFCTLHLILTLFHIVSYSIITQQNLLSLNPYTCLVGEVICVALIPFLQMGYETLVRAILALVFYLYAWSIIIIDRDFIVGPGAVATACFFVVPTVYFFDGKGQRISTFLILISNFLLLGVYLKCFPCHEAVTLSSETINLGVSTNIISMSTYILLMIRFNILSNAVYEDVKSANARIESSTKEKENFFATVSHEIRNPLQSLLGAVELLQDKGVKSETAASLLEICKNCSALVINLVSNVLDLEKIAADKMQLCPAPASLREITRRIVQMHQGRAQSKGVRLLLIDDTSLPPAIELDTQRIEQILVNVVSNAIKFTSKGKVAVKLGWTPLADHEDPLPVVQDALKRSSWKEIMEFTERYNSSSQLQSKYTKMPNPSLDENVAPQSVISQGTPSPQQNCHHGIAKIEVMDTGIGISKGNIEKLFRQYQQADVQISRRYGGTGLGLWITKNILHQMKGDIKVKSKEGKGSNFILAFPANVPEEIRAISNWGNGAVEGTEILKGKTYLLLDDISENMFIMKELLGRYGVNAITAQNGMDAIEIYKANKNIDAVITDLRMPLMSGQVFIAELRKYEQESHRKATLIAVLTAETSLEEKRLCLTQYGADEFLLKPVKYEELLATLVKMHSQNKRAKKKRVLVIDDDLISSSFLTTVLEQNGHQCKRIHSVSEAKEHFKENYAEYDVILLDNLLRDGTGVDFLEFATQFATSVGSHVPPTVSISGNPIPDQKMQYELYQLAGYLQKPVKRRELLEIIQVIQALTFR
eukprot:TRINITY_DN162_c0_g1_i1.p1 TRINITY_DN162_c0_g1~~TRINITY_DN162_c0_g1_i1.p1  ORF type:complete len:837 (+),score=57.54 TRINITY_DN162_c0_g1_i1:155-2512(+)